MGEPWRAYYDKADNLRSRPERAVFWDSILGQTEASVIVEVGCGDGLNLEHLERLHVACVIGIDAYAPALGLARTRLGPLTDLRIGDATHLDGFASRSVDLAFTCTTLQHIASDIECRAAIRELKRVSAKWVLVMEYSADERTPVLWRGDPEGIVKRPWWDFMEKEGLTIVGTGLLRQEDGFDDVSWYLSKR